MNLVYLFLYHVMNYKQMNCAESSKFYFLCAFTIVNDTEIFVKDTAWSIKVFLYPLQFCLQKLMFTFLTPNDMSVFYLRIEVIWSLTSIKGQEKNNRSTITLATINLTVGRNFLLVLLFVASLFTGKFVQITPGLFY